MPTPSPGSSTGVWNRVPGAESDNDSEPECDCCGMYSPRPRPGLCSGGGDRDDWEPKRLVLRSASDIDEEARKPSLFCTTTTGKEWSCCPGSVSAAVIAVRRLALACMGGANGSSLVATTNPCSALLVEAADGDDDDAEGDRGWEGGREALLPGNFGDGCRVGDAGVLPETDCRGAHDPTRLRLLEDDGGRLRGSS